MISGSGVAALVVAGQQVVDSETLAVGHRTHRGHDEFRLGSSSRQAIEALTKCCEADIDAEGLLDDTVQLKRHDLEIERLEAMQRGDCQGGATTMPLSGWQAVDMWTAEQEHRLRTEAMTWLAARTQDGLNPLHTEEIGEFTFEGDPFRLMDPQRGIRKPAGFSSALSIRTVWRREGAARPYDDDLGADGLIRYKWRGEDPDHAENRALRAAMYADQPLIWFWGVGPALYQCIFPIYLVGEERQAHQFAVATDGLQHLRPTDSPIEETLRRYLRAETVRRLHQPVFRSMVMRAYTERCAVCALRHGELLDAAHIVEDRHELGVAAVRNGLALCKIHHAAYDSGILGVTPDLVEHGLKRLHGQRLRSVPSSRRKRPDPDLLAVRFERFQAG